MTTQNESDDVPLLQSYLQLLRAPNLFTAMADVAMGFCFVQAAWAWRGAGPSAALRSAGTWGLGLLVAASTLLYAAGVVLNDVFDIEADREERPDRPLPSGRISLQAARRLGWNLLCLGILLPFGLTVMLQRLPEARAGNWLVAYLPAVVAVGLAATIVLYNAVLKWTVAGPVAMGVCRMLNVLLGMSVLRATWGAEHWIVAGGIGIYIAGVTWFARDEAQRSDRRRLAAATLTIAVGVALVGSLPSWSPDRWLFRQDEIWRWYVLIAAFGGYIVLRCLWAVGEPSPGAVQATVGRSILSLILLDAIVCYAACGRDWTIPIALLIVPATLLGRWIDST